MGELTLALKEEKHRPDPIRGVFIPKANGKLRPLGISATASVRRSVRLPGVADLVSYARSLTPTRTCNKSADSERKFAMTH